MTPRPALRAVAPLRLHQECPFPHKAGTVSKLSAMEHTGVVEVPTKIREEMANTKRALSDWTSQRNEGVGLFKF